MRIRKSDLRFMIAFAMVYGLFVAVLGTVMAWLLSWWILIVAVPTWIVWLWLWPQAIRDWRA